MTRRSTTLVPCPARTRSAAAGAARMPSHGRRPADPRGPHHRSAHHSSAFACRASPEPRRPSGARRGRRVHQRPGRRTPLLRLHRVVAARRARGDRRAHEHAAAVDGCHPRRQPRPGAARRGLRDRRRAVGRPRRAVHRTRHVLPAHVRRVRPGPATRPRHLRRAPRAAARALDSATRSTGTGRSARRCACRRRDPDRSSGRDRRSGSARARRPPPSSWPPASGCG